MPLANGKKEHIDVRIGTQFNQRNWPIVYFHRAQLKELSIAYFKVYFYNQFIPNLFPSALTSILVLILVHLIHKVLKYTQ